MKVATEHSDNDVSSAGDASEVDGIGVEVNKSSRKRHRRSSSKGKSSAHSRDKSKYSSGDNSDHDGGLVAQVLKQISPALSQTSSVVTSAAASNDPVLAIRQLELQQENLKLQIELEHLKRRI